MAFTQVLYLSTYFRYLYFTYVVQFYATLYFYSTTFLQGDIVSFSHFTDTDNYTIDYQLI